MTNKELIERYPFLIPRNVWTDEITIDLDTEEIEYTLLDDMPDGWRKAFGEQMCEEIREVLIKYDYLDKYRITQIKEKYASLRWYNNSAPKEVFDIVSKYEELSYTTCIQCGKTATLISKGWISPYCDACAKTHRHYNPNRYVPIKEFYGIDNNDKGDKNNE